MRSFLNEFYDDKRAQSHWDLCTKRETVLTQIFGVSSHEINRIRCHTFLPVPLRWWQSDPHIPFSWSGGNAWLGITSGQSSVGITLVEMIDRVCLALLAHSTQLWLNITTSIFPHAPVVGSLGEEELVVGDPGGSAGVGGRPVGEAGGGRGVEAWRGLPTFLKIGFTLRGEWTEHMLKRILLFEFWAAKMRREVCLFQLWNELWSTRNRKLFNLDFWRGKKTRNGEFNESCTEHKRVQFELFNFSEAG